MPNWCTNILTVSGDADDVARFVDDVFVSDERPLSFAAVVPPPTDDMLEAEWGDGNTPGWYTWNLTNWGTKWDANFAHFGFEFADKLYGELVDAFEPATVTATTAVYMFDTAWSPPDAFVRAASGRFPDLEFVLRYGEPGAAFAGEIACVGGLVIRDEITDAVAEEDVFEFLREEQPTA